MESSLFRVPPTRPVRWLDRNPQRDQLAIAYFFIRHPFTAAELESMWWDVNGECLSLFLPLPPPPLPLPAVHDENIKSDSQQWRGSERGEKEGSSLFDSIRKAYYIGPDKLANESKGRPSQCVEGQSTRLEFPTLDGMHEKRGGRKNKWTNAPRPTGVRPGCVCVCVYKRLRRNKRGPTHAHIVWTSRHLSLYRRSRLLNVYSNA